MTIQPPYTTGTVTLEQGSTAIVGNDTGWGTALVAGGVMYVEAIGNALPLASVEDEDAATAAVRWRGASGTYNYAIVRENAAAASIAWVNDRLAQILVRMVASGIPPSKIGTLTERNALSLGVDDDQFIFLRAEVGEPWEFYRWSGTAWIGPFDPRGQDGDPGPAGDPVALGDLDDVGISAPGDGDLLAYDGDLLSWVNVPLGTWIPVSIVGGEATIDLADGDRFIIVVNGDCELQVPDNPRTKPFAIRIVYSGSGHAFTFAEGWLGQTPAVLTADGDETILSGIVLDTSPAVTALLNLVKAIPA